MPAGAGAGGNESANYTFSTDNGSGGAGGTGGGGGGGGYGFEQTSPGGLPVNGDVAFPGGAGGIGGGVGGVATTEEGGGGGGGGGLGGAIFNFGGTVEILNSTLVDNTAEGAAGATDGGGGSGLGGAIFNLDGSLSIIDSTIANNTLAAGSGGTSGITDGAAVYNLEDSSQATTRAIVTLDNSILAGSVVGGGDLTNNGGTVAGQDNLVPTSSGTISSGVITSTVTPQFGTLQNNGGPTPTVLPALLSGLIDSGSVTVAAGFGLTTDQRQAGFPRSDSNGVDLGAIQSPLTGPSIISASSAQFLVGQANSFMIIASSKPLSVLTETGALPAGLSFVDNGNGTATLSGTPASSTIGETFTIDITATNNTGTTQSASQTFALTIVQPAAITSVSSGTLITGQTGSLTIATVGFPTPVLTETGALPAGLSFVDNGNGTANLSGTPAADSGGTYTFSIDAHNGILADAVQTFTLTVYQPPVITSPDFNAFREYTFGTATITATGFPTPTITESGALPNGLTFIYNDNGTATLSGYLTTESAGSYTLTFTASNGVGTGVSQTFSLQVSQELAITSAATVSGWTGQPVSFTVTTNGFPVPSLSYSGELPSGLTFVDNGNGTATISGVTPNLYAGTYPLSITATNSLEYITVPLDITINQSPEIVSTPTDFTFNEGQNNSFTVRAIGAPNLYLEENGLVPGLTFVDNGDGTGTLSGTPPLGSGGVYDLTFFAADGAPTFASQALTLTIPQAPSIESASSAVFVAGQSGTITVATGGFPTATLTELGNLPTGVTFVDNGNGTATLSGTPVGNTGNFPVTISADNGSGAAVTQSFNLAVDPVLAITTNASTDVPLDQSDLFGVGTNALVPSSATFTENGALPPGMTFDPSTGVFSGTPTATGNYPVIVTAQTPDGQTSAPQNLTLIVGQAPGISVDNQFRGTFLEGQSGTFTFAATGNPAPEFSETGDLPAGVTFVDNGDGTATLSGTPASGTVNAYPISIEAQNAFGYTNISFFLNVLTVATPVSFTSGTTATFSAGQSGTFTVTTVGTPVPALSVVQGSLPGGLTLVDNGNGTATLSGTPDSSDSGPYFFSLGANNNGDSSNVIANPDSEQSFELDVDHSPAITATGSTTFTVGQDGYLPLQLSGFPTPTLTMSGSLPAGVTFDAPYGLVGTPAPGTGGTYPLNFDASNGVGSDATLNLTLTVDQQPMITSSGVAQFVVGQNGSFTITTSGSPTAAISESGALPSGVTFDNNGNGTATLSGTPAVGGYFAYDLTITANNGAGQNSVQYFTLNVGTAPTFYPTDSATTFAVGQSGSFLLNAGGYPAPTISETGSLPTGVSVVQNADGTETLEGTPAAGTGGIYTFRVTASNGLGAAAAEEFTLTVDENARFTSPASFTDLVGYPIDITPTATGYPLPRFITYTGELPSYISFNPSQDLFSGVPTAVTPSGEPDLIHLVINNLDGTTAIQTVEINVLPQPTFTSGSSVTVQAGQPFSFKVTTNSVVTPALLANIPGYLGYTFVDNGNGTGTLSGTPLALGLVAIELEATIGNSTVTSELSLDVVGAQTQFTSATNATFGVGQAGTFTVSATGAETAKFDLIGTDQVSASGELGAGGSLPSGLTFVDNGNGTATISGTAPTAAAGTYSVYIEAGPISPEPTQVLNLVIANPGPAQTLSVTGAPSSVTAGGAASFTVTARDANGLIATGYTGKVKFSSSDPQAVLPASYTFTAADAGVHTFSVTLKSAGTKSITVTDAASSGVTGSASVTVNPATASTLRVAAPASVQQGSAFTLTVTAVDAYGNTATGYTGTVALSSSDSHAVLPGSYTFKSSDMGVHSFTVTLNTAGTQSITAKDSTTSTIAGTDAQISVAGFSVDDGGPQGTMVESLIYTFASPTDVEPGAFELFQGGKASRDKLVIAPQPGGATYVMTFTGPGVAGGLLPEGDYTLITLHKKVKVLSGPPMTQNDINHFVSRSGDAHRGNKVSGASSKGSGGQVDPPKRAPAKFRGRTVLHQSAVRPARS